MGHAYARKGVAVCLTLEHTDTKSFCCDPEPEFSWAFCVVLLEEWVLVVNL